MKILLTTPGGNIGRRVLWELLAPEFSVRVIARDAAELPEEIREQVEIVCGSADDAGTLRRALEGVEALFWCVPPAPAQETSMRGHYERFARAACQAIRQAGTSRVVSISAGGKGFARNAGLISGLHAMEDTLNESGAAIRHLRCAPFMEDLLRQLEQIRQDGILSYPMPGNIQIPMAAVRDIAEVALRFLARRTWKGIEGVAVHGPADLTYDQTAAIMQQVLARPIRYREIPSDDYVQTLVSSGASVQYARSVAEMFAELAHGIMRAEPRTVQSTTRTTLAAWVENELLPLVVPLTTLSEIEAACPCEV